MQTGNLTGDVSLAGITLTLNLLETAEGAISHDLTLPKGYDGSLTTRTTDTSGVVTATGHNLTISDYVDIYWSGGLAYGGDVTDVTGDAITVSALAGDVLPTQGSSVVISKRTTIDIDFDGDLMKMIAATAGGRGHLAFEDSGGVVLDAVELPSTGSWFWVDGLGWANPLTGNPVDSVEASTEDTAADQNLKLGVLYDSVS